MLCQFQVYSKVIQLYTYIYLFFFRFFSPISYYRILSRVPCAIQQVLVVYRFHVQQCVYVNPKLLIYPCPPQFFPECLLYIGVVFQALGIQHVNVTDKTLYSLMLELQQTNTDKYSVDQKEKRPEARDIRLLRTFRQLVRELEPGEQLRAWKLGLQSLLLQRHSECHLRSPFLIF